MTPPTESADPTFHAPARHRLRRWLLLWSALYVAGLLGYNSSYPHTQNLFIHQLQVRPAAWLLNLTRPEAQVTATKDRLQVPGLTLVVRRGCDGVEAWLLLVTALAAFPMPWRGRLRNMAYGTLLIYGLNLARIVTLFQLARTQPQWFDLAHGLVWQSIMVLAAAGFVLVRLPTPGRTAGSPAA